MAVGDYTGTKWGSSAQGGTTGGQVSWSFNLAGARFYGFDAAIFGDAARVAVRAAFDLWEGIADIDFTEVATAAAQIQVGWDAMDGVGNTLAEATWSYGGGLTTHAEIAFDSAESWTAPARGGPSLYVVAVHEVGHAIGLSHTTDPASIMYPYLGPQAQLSGADVSAIQTLYGAPGLALTGTSASETLLGGSGRDTIEAGQGNDVVQGFYGNDLIFGNQGQDILFGNQGADTIHAGQDNDIVYGGQDNDLLMGNLGDDTVNGNLGDDTVHGGQGNDLVHGGQGNDRVYGDLGNDTLHGGFGDDTLAGGEGADLFVFGRGMGRDTVTDFRAFEGDRLSFEGQTYVTEEYGGSTILTLSGGGVVTLLGVTNAVFEASAVV